MIIKQYTLPCGRAIRFIRMDGTNKAIVERWLLPTGPGNWYIGRVIKAEAYFPTPVAAWEGATPKRRH